MKICKDSKLCTGCTACSNVCPKKCIEMTPNSEGFLYPTVDEDRCVNCHQCINVCPVNFPRLNKGYKLGKIVRTTDRDLLLKCASGGAFSQIALNIIKQNGVAVGAVYDKDFVVRHSIIKDKVEVEKLSGSKYVQSNLDYIFSTIKQMSIKGTKVVFCGTPCQVSGLYNYLGNNIANVYLIDLVCHGVPSPLLWEKYVKLNEKKYGSILHANFRSKAYGYHVTTMETVYKNGKNYRGSARTDLMSKCFFKNIADRESCYNCQFKTVDRCSDMTIFDSWHASELNVNLQDDDRGYSNVICHTKKGYELLELIKDSSEQYDMDYTKAINLDGSMMIKSVDRPKIRDNFYEELNENGIEKVVDKFIPIKQKDYFVEKIKFVASKIGIARFIKKIKDY